MFSEDLSAFFADFGASSCTVAGQPVQAIFDNGHALGSVGPIGIATTQPRLTCATAALPADPVGAPVVVGAASYMVTEHQPDGTGISLLLLDVAA
jgi:hypothetical protein